MRLSAISYLCQKMSGAKISTRDGARSTLEDFSIYSNINNAPKLRHQTTDEGLNDGQSQAWQNELNRGSFGTVRTFSPTGRQKRSVNRGGVFSFLNGSTEPDIKSDLSTRHVEYDDDDSKGKIKNMIWSRIPGSEHFLISDNLKFILNCCMWYISSSLTNNIGKSIMNAFRFPVTLTFIQFGLVAFWCYIVSAVFKTTHIRTPTQDILQTITPLAVFLIVGHVFSSVAISRVPVSLVHTIKVKIEAFFLLLLLKIYNNRLLHLCLQYYFIGSFLECSIHIEFIFHYYRLRLE